MTNTNRVLSSLFITTLLLATNGSLTNSKSLDPQSDQQVTLVPQLGHVAYFFNSGVTAIVIGPDSKTVITGGGDGTIKIWDLVTGLLTRSFNAHVGGVQSIALSPDGNTIASGGGDKQVRLWDVKTGRLQKSLEGHETGVNCLAFSLSGELLASGSGSYADVGTASDNTIRIWNVPGGTLKQVLRGHRQQVRSIAFNGEGTRLVSGSYDKSLIVWNLVSGQMLKINTEAIDSVRFSPDGKRIASAAAQQILFWNVDSGVLVGSIRHSSYNTQVAFTPDWRLVVIDTELWDVASGVKIRSLAEVNGSYGQTTVSNDGSVVASGGYAGFVTWDSLTGHTTHVFNNTSAFTTGIVFNKSGDKLAWGRQNDIYVWDLKRAKLLRVLRGHEDAINEVTFSPDGQTLASCSDNAIKFWSISTGENTRTLSSATNGVDGFQSIQFSPNGLMLAAGGSIGDQQEGVTLWNARTWRPIKTLTIREPDKVIGLRRLAHAGRVPGGPATEVHSISFSPDGRLLAAGADNSDIIIWNIGRLREFKTLTGHDQAVNSVSFSHDGKRLLSGSFDQTVKVWDVLKRTVVVNMSQHHGHVTSARFSPDDKTVVSGSVDQGVRLWNSASGKLMNTLEGHDGAVTFVAFSPDGKLVASTGFDGRVNLWSTVSGALISTVLAFDDQSWIDFSPDGYFSGSPSVTRNIAWRVGDAIYPGETLGAQRQNVDLLIARTSGTTPPFIPQSPVFSPVEAVKDVTPLAEYEKKLIDEWKDHKFYALVIGVGHYKYLEPLKTALNDAADLKRILEERYDFEVKLLPDATKEQILNQLETYEKTLPPNSSLLIFYAGHGVYLDLGDRREGVWLPVDAKADNRFNWIRSTDILESIKLMSASQILIVSDSCFSGALFTRSGPFPQINERPEVLFSLLKQKSWTLVASGGTEPVDDEGEDGHSVFARALLNALRTTPQNVFTMDHLFHNFIYDAVKDRATQEPKIRPIPGFNDEGRFVFMRRRRK